MKPGALAHGWGTSCKWTHLGVRFTLHFAASYYLHIRPVASATGFKVQCISYGSPVCLHIMLSGCKCNWVCWTMRFLWRVKNVFTLQPVAYGTSREAGCKKANPPEFKLSIWATFSLGVSNVWWESGCQQCISPQKQGSKESCCLVDLYPVSPSESVEKLLCFANTTSFDDYFVNNVWFMQ